MLMVCTSVATAATKHAALAATYGNGLIHLQVTIDDGFHAQSHTPLDPNLIPLTVTMLDAADVAFDAPSYPQPTIEEYAGLGKVSVYTGAVTIDVPVHLTKPSAQGVTLSAVKLSGTLRLQICNSNTCFAPQKLPFDVSIGATIGDISATMAATTPSTQAAAPVEPIKVQSESTSTHGIAWALGSALLAGLIFNVMPCVLPVLPLKAIGFYEVSQHRRGRTLLLGLFFSLGMIGIFALLAVLLLAGKTLLGRQFSWGQQFSYPWFVWSMATLLAVLGFGLLGAFSVRLPTSIYGLSFRHDTLTGNFLWGGLTAVLSTPCTAPLFPPLLGWALGQSLAIGMLSVITVGVGMSLPYLVLSAVPELARRFPRVGPGAELIKQMMGFLLLSTAAFLVGVRLLGEPNQWWLVLLVIGIACTFLIIKTIQIAKSRLAMIITAVIAVVLFASCTAEAVRLTRRGLWTDYSPELLAAAQANDRPVVIDFTAAWCLNCKYIEQTVYHDGRTLATIKAHNVLLIRADLTDSHAPGWALLDQLGGTGIPFTAVYLPRNRQPITFESIYGTDQLLEAINR